MNITFEKKRAWIILDEGSMCHLFSFISYRELIIIYLLSRNYHVTDKGFQISYSFEKFLSAEYYQYQNVNYFLPSSLFQIITNELKMNGKWYSMHIRLKMYYKINTQISIPIIETYSKVFSFFKMVNNDNFCDLLLEISCNIKDKTKNNCNQRKIYFFH